MKIFIKIAIRILPVIVVLTLLYIGYLHFWGDRSQNTWFGRKYSQADIKAESAKAYAFFESYYDSILTMNPELESSLAIKDQQNKWTDLSEDALDRRLAFYKKSLQYLNDSILLDRLDSANQISYLVLERQLNIKLEADKYRHFDYPVSLMHGVQIEIVDLLIQQHQIQDKKDAWAYISRLKAVPEKIEQLISALIVREEKGVLLPKFLFPKIIDACREIISGFPYNPVGLKKNVIYQDFLEKVTRLSTVDKQIQKDLLDSCKASLKNQLKPAYQKLIELLKNQAQKANNNAGYWKVQDGENYYAFKLKEQTFTQLSANEVYDLGTEEIQRIHKEMITLKDKIGFQGTLKAFFNHLRSANQFYFPNTAKGKQAYLEEANQILDSIVLALPKVFNPIVNQRISLKDVNAFSAIYGPKSSYSAYYSSPDTWNAIYFINLNNLEALPKYQIEALVYKDAIPGRHTQISFARKQSQLPRFRRFAQGATAFTEGWSLYAANIPKELGFYTDPYSDFGRLAMELWHACALVVDVGIHTKRWTREQAIQFYLSNAANVESDCIKMVEDQIVSPASATAAKIGMISILELKQKAKTALADKFNLKDFHDVVLKNGAISLQILEDLVDGYIKAKKAK